MKNFILIIIAATMLASCEKQAPISIWAPESTSKKVKGNTTLETNIASGLIATITGSSIVLTYNFFGQSVQFTQLQGRYTDPSGQVQTITYTWDNGTTTQSDGWVAYQTNIWSYTGPVSGYTLTNVVPGTYDFRLWVQLTDGSWATSDLVTITIP